MRTKNFTKITFLLTLGFVLHTAIVGAQPWSGSYGNEWLTGKYGQTWLRIPVKTRGIIKVSLPAAFQNKPGKLHLYRRGAEVTLISASNTEIEFFGIPNDGSSDALIYRTPETRRNPHTSLFSDVSAYFLTFDGNDRPVAASDNLAPDNGVALQEFHNFTYLKKFEVDFSHMTTYPTRPTQANSFYEEGKQYTGTRLAAINLSTWNSANKFPAPIAANPAPNSWSLPGYVAEDFAYPIKSRFGSGQPVLDIHIKGRGYRFTHTLELSVHFGATKATIDTARNNAVAKINVTGYRDHDFSNLQVPNSYIDGNGNGGGAMSFRGFSYNTGGGYSVSYYTVKYDQKIDMQSLNSYEFNFPAAGSNTRISILNQPAGGGLRFIDVTNPDQPRIINGNAANLMMSRNGNAMKLHVTKDVNTVPGESITFTAIDPSQYDYLIVTNELLSGVAQTYATYRQSESPRNTYNPIVAKVKDIYNQFNYGEVSPVAIRRFVDYMISDNNKAKFLLLIGANNLFHETFKKEMEGEVPTIGFPGADLLLVDGLKGTPDDVPTIPYGRIPATTAQQVTDYLNKVKEYESDKGDVDWRKKVMHVSGGKDVGEINRFKNHLANIAVQSGITTTFGGPAVEVRSKTIGGPNQGTIETLDITAEVNAGIGMISYFGHGGVSETDLNFGYAMAENKGYKNSKKYPVLFYNGCGVNNVFAGLTGLYNDALDKAPNPPGTKQAGTIRPMSTDWLFAPNKGAIVVFGNDWDAYEIESNEYLKRLYPEIFSKSDKDRKTIGEIIQATALKTKLALNYSYQSNLPATDYNYDRANVHQIILQGDPAMTILDVKYALPVELISFDAKLIEPKKVEVSWKTDWEKNNSHFIVERSYNAKNFEDIGFVEGRGDADTLSSYTFYDTNPLPGTSYYRLKQIDKEGVVDGKIVEGKVTHSSIVSVTRTGTSLVVVSPNPARDFATVTIDAPVKVKGWDILDQKGHVYKRDGVGAKVDLSGLASGEYIIKIDTENNDVYFKKIVKQ